jgi:hypothetical protein
VVKTFPYSGLSCPFVCFVDNPFGCGSAALHLFGFASLRFRKPSNPHSASGRLLMSFPPSRPPHLQKFSWFSNGGKLFLFRCAMYRRHLLPIAFLLALPCAAGATPQEEKIMNEKSAREEAAAKPFEELYRVMLVSFRPYAEYGAVTKLYLTLRDGSRAASGWVTVKVRFAGAGFAERSRALTPDEVDRVWKIFHEEEIFGNARRPWTMPAIPATEASLCSPITTSAPAAPRKSSAQTTRASLPTAPTSTWPSRSMTWSRNSRK